MNTERFAQLADAYGADMRRWPESDREAASGWAAREPDAARLAMAEAAALDGMLADWRPPAVTADLRQRVLATAPRSRPARTAIRYWLSGAGLAAACAAGLVVGVAGSSAAVADARADELLAAATPDDASTTLTPFTVSDGRVLTRQA